MLRNGREPKIPSQSVVEQINFRIYDDHEKAAEVSKSDSEPLFWFYDL
jgi:hypothetical protein